MIEILAAATLNTVQDCGRPAQRRFGVGSSGAMDGVALRVGNALLGNDENAAGIEVQVFPFAVRFTQARGFAITGADCRATLDDRPLPPWWTTGARAGQVLRLHPPLAGARAYLTVAGGLAVPMLLGSRSTHLRGGFGGHEGRALVDGDVLAVGYSECPCGPTVGVDGPTPPSAELSGIRAIPAADHDDFPEATQAVFWSSAWRISAQSNRHGFRLIGPKLEGADRFNLRSSPIMPGIVQVPPGGSPIVQMSDANSAGGYPKMATVIAADLPRLSQVRLGGAVRFERVDGAVAAAAQRVQSEFVANARRMLAVWRRGRDVAHSAD